MYCGMQMGALIAPGGGVWPPLCRSDVLAGTLVGVNLAPQAEHLSSLGETRLAHVGHLRVGTLNVALHAVAFGPTAFPQVGQYPLAVDALTDALSRGASSSSLVVDALTGALSGGACSGSLAVGALTGALSRGACSGSAGEVFLVLFPNFPKQHMHRPMIGRQACRRFFWNSSIPNTQSRRVPPRVVPRMSANEASSPLFDNALPSTTPPLSSGGGLGGGGKYVIGASAGWLKASGWARRIEPKPATVAISSFSVPTLSTSLLPTTIPQA